MRAIFTAAAAVLIATPALAGTDHWASRPTQEAAMLAATDAARARAARKDTCFKPAWTVNQCVAEAGAVRCLATSADHYGSCHKSGWLPPHSQWEGDRGSWSISIPVYPLPCVPPVFCPTGNQVVSRDHAERSWRFWE